MKVITYHYYKSTGVGGVESLIRHLQTLSLDMDWDVEEVYHGISGTEINPEINGVQYQQMANNEGRKNLISKGLGFITRRIKTFNFFKAKVNECGVIILFHPALLNWLPKNFIDKNKIILVQTNKVDVYFNLLGKLGFFRRNKNVDLVTVYTDADKVKLLKTYSKLGLEEKVSIIPRACRFRSSTETTNFSYKLVTIARVEESQKNFKSMLEIIKLLPSHYTLDIYGSGHKFEVENLKEMISNEPRVKFNGVTDAADAVLKKYSLFIMTSHYEGFGQTLIEARSQGLAIVAFDTFEALQSIVESGFNGEVIQPYDHSAFSDAIQRILASPEEHLKYATNSLYKSKETDEENVSHLWQSNLLNLFENK